MSAVRAIKYTDLGGNPVWVVDTWVQGIRKAKDGEFQQNAHTIIILSGHEQAIQEDLELALQLFNAARG